MDDNGLEKLRKRLYKKEETFRGRFEEPELSYKPEPVEREWKAESAEELIAKEFRAQKFLKMKTIVIIASIFVLGIAVLAGVYLFGGFGIISSRNIELKIEGPKEAAGGELVRWEVVIHNKNDVGLATAEIAFRYPQGFRPVNKQALISLIERKSLGEVPRDGIFRETFSAFAFGPQDFEGEIEVALEYRTDGSNAIFEKIEKSAIKITRSPVGVALTIPAELNVGREINFEARVTSNASDVIQNLMLELIYPPGFTFKDSSPKTSEGQNRWSLGDLSPGEERTIKISGIFEGEDMEQRSVIVQAGVLEDRTLNIYGSASANFILRKLFVELAATIGGQDIVSVRGGETLNVEIMWRNNLPQAVQNATLEVTIEGGAIDEASINADRGFYRGFDKKIIWTPSSLKEFASIGPGETGQARFNFKLLDAVLLARQNLKNPTVKIKGEIKPAIKPPGFETIDIEGQFELELKVETLLQLSSRAIYYSAILPGSGPLSPKVGQETIYTVIWSLANASSDVSDVAVKAALPAYMRWKGVVRPTNEIVNFDSSKSEISWRSSRIMAGTGFTQPAKEVMFQVGLIPSVGQVGSSPVLLFDIVAEGRDDFSGNIVRDAEPSLTTDISAFDRGLKSGEEKVRP